MVCHNKYLKEIFYNTKVWCGASRPEALQSKLKTAVHAPGKYRWGTNIGNNMEDIGGAI